MNKLLITGGAGFIGSNAALVFAQSGWNVTILDNFSRKGAEANIAWLRERASVSIVRVDIRNLPEFEKVFAHTQFDVVLHLAAQVAVTTSVVNPREDFDINAAGTLNLLECLRRLQPQAQLIYASTNKVYGRMEHVGVVERNGRYEYESLAQGAGEEQALDFHSPYGCSKGAADQYVLDYARIYGLRTTCFRQSCIYGPRQFGVEDQGWVAWFIIASVLNKNITIYGDGKQIRDLLHVHDLVGAYEAAIANPDKCSGQAFNIGGGPKNTLSLLELVSMLKTGLQKEIPLTFDTWRPGDQPVFVCNVQKARQQLSWEPKIGVEEGVDGLIAWVKENKNLFTQ